MSQKSIFEIQADLCRCMSNALRIEIVHYLRNGPKRVTDIVNATAQPQATISRHLGVLRDGGVLSAQRQGQDVYYQIANFKILHICDLMKEVLVEEAIIRSRLVQGVDETGEE